MLGVGVAATLTLTLDVAAADPQVTDPGPVPRDLYSTCGEPNPNPNPNPNHGCHLRVCFGQRLPVHVEVASLARVGARVGVGAGVRVGVRIRVRVRGRGRVRGRVTSFSRKMEWVWFCEIRMRLSRTWLG